MNADKKSYVSDRELVIKLQDSIKLFVDKKLKNSKKSTSIIVETSGGVLSPGPNKTLQADLYRKLRLPIVLVGDSKLGGITATISALESLRLRGYTVYAVAIIERGSSTPLGNAEMIQEYFKNTFGNSDHSGIDSRIPQVFSFSSLPGGKERTPMLHDWYRDNQCEFL